MPAMGLKAAFLLVAVSFVFSVEIDDKPTMCQVDTIRNFVMKKIEEIKIKTGQEDWQYMAKKKRGIDGELLIEFKEIVKSIDTYTNPILPEAIVQALWSFAVIELEENNIQAYYTAFKRFQNKPDPLLFKNDWSDFAYTCLNNSPNKHSALKSLEIIQDMISDNIEGHKNIFQLAHEESDSKSLKCERDQSIQQMLFNMYNILQLTQLKAYTMVQFSWMILRVYEKGNFTLESEMFRQQYLIKVEQQANTAVREMKDAPSEFMKCDPVIHKKDDTYTEITRFLQGYIVNEVDLNGDGTCREDCAYYRYTKQQSCFKDKFCAQQPLCRGNIVGCNFVDSDMWVCQAPASSMRRYDWIEYENGRNLGQRQSCSRSVTKVDSWWRYLFWHCSYCFCFCDDPSDHRSHRYFNLRSVTSDTENNKVIVGMRFIKRNKVIHLQVQEGKLIPNGQINASTVTWRPVDDYDVNDYNVRDGVDYHQLSWEQRAIDLDDLIAPENYVLTGLKFRKVGSHLNLEIQVSKMNFTNGTLDDNGKKSMWISNDNTDASPINPRTKVNLIKPDSPIKNGGLNIPDSTPDQYMEFTSSDNDFDAGQTVVPFLDTQIIAPQPPVILKGVGLYHKGKKYSGGFIAPKVYTYNFSDHILNFFPEVNEANSETL